MRYINGTRLDDRIVRTDWDAGFIEGRQYGRGKSGGQVSWHKLHEVLYSCPVNGVFMYCPPQGPPVLCTVLTEKCNVAEFY